jgi:hypothetical protein
MAADWWMGRFNVLRITHRIAGALQGLAHAWLARRSTKNNPQSSSPIRSCVQVPMVLAVEFFLLSTRKPGFWSQPRESGPLFITALTCRACDLPNLCFACMSVEIIAHLIQDFQSTSLIRGWPEKCGPSNREGGRTKPETRNHWRPWKAVTYIPVGMYAYKNHRRF